MGDDPGDRGPPAGGLLAAEPAQPHGSVPLGVPEVLEQGVQPRGLGVVRLCPARHRDAGRTAGQAAVDDTGAQTRVQVEALRALQQADRLAQPPCLVGAPAAVPEVLLDGGGLLGGAGRQRPCAQQRLEDRVLQPERLREVRRGRGGQRQPAVLDGRAGQRYARRPTGPGAGDAVPATAVTAAIAAAGAALPSLPSRPTRSAVVRPVHPGGHPVFPGFPGVPVFPVLPGLPVLAALAPPAPFASSGPVVVAVTVAAVVRRPGARVAHAAPPYPGGAPGAAVSWAVDSSWRPRRSRRRASSSVTPRSAAVWR